MNVQGIALSSCINRYLFRVVEYNDILCRVADTPLFVDSRITPGIQIADLARMSRGICKNYAQCETGGGWLQPLGERVHRVVQQSLTG